MLFKMQITGFPQEDAERAENGNVLVSFLGCLCVLLFLKFAPPLAQYKKQGPSEVRRPL